MRLLKSFIFDLSILILILFGFSNVRAQSDSLINNTSYQLITWESQAFYKGGIEAEKLYFKEKLSGIFPPEKYRTDKKPYTLRAHITVEKDGSITNIYLLKKYQLELNQETQQKILSVIRSMQKWTPAKILGEPKRSNYIIPITLNNN